MGVQIAMSKFSEVDYDPTTQTVTFGAGLVWDDVYKKLDTHEVNVVGGRVSGVGVAGFTLGGGMFEWYLRWKDIFNGINRLLVAHKSTWFDDRHGASI